MPLPKPKSSGRSPQWKFRMGAHAIAEIKKCYRYMKDPLA